MTFQYIKDMRGRLGLEENDTSRDAYIEGLEPIQRLRLIAGWNLGYDEWAHKIMDWVRDAGFKIKDN